MYKIELIYYAIIGICCFKINIVHDCKIKRSLKLIKIKYVKAKVIFKLIYNKILFIGTFKHLKSLH